MTRAGSGDDAAGARRRRDHGRDHVPRQHRDEGLPEEPDGDARRRSPAAGSIPATWRCMHPDGYMKIKDRSKDIIISGGENISSHRGRGRAVPASRRCCAAAVVAQPDAKWGETPCAFVELKAGRERHGRRRSSRTAAQHLARLQGAAARSCSARCRRPRPARSRSSCCASGRKLTAAIDTMSAMSHDRTIPLVLRDRRASASCTLTLNRPQADQRAHQAMLAALASELRRDCARSNRARGRARRRRARRSAPATT